MMKSFHRRSREIGRHQNRLDVERAALFTCAARAGFAFPTNSFVIGFHNVVSSGVVSHATYQFRNSTAPPKIAFRWAVFDWSTQEVSLPPCETAASRLGFVGQST